MAKDRKPLAERRVYWAADGILGRDHLLRLLQQRPNPADERKDKEGVCQKRQWRRSRQYCSPQKIGAAVIAKRIAPTMLTKRVQAVKVLGTPVSRRAADHKAVPAANAGTLPSRVAAVPDSM